MRCDWVHYPMFALHLRGRERGERCPEDARWMTPMADGQWNLCEHHKGRYIEAMNEDWQKREKKLWKRIRK